MTRITKSLRAFFCYLLCPIIFDGEFGVCIPSIRRDIQFFFLIITVVSAVIFRSFLAFAVPILVYVSVCIICYRNNFRDNFESFYDETSPLTYERFLAEYTCFPDRIRCDDYISMFTLYLIVDDVEDRDQWYIDKDENVEYRRFIKPQTFPDAVLIYYYLLPIHIDEKKKKYEKEAAEHKKQRSKQEIENYAIYKKYLKKDLETLGAQTDEKTAKYRAIVEELEYSP